MSGYQSSETLLRWILRGAVFLVFLLLEHLRQFLKLFDTFRIR